MPEFLESALRTSASRRGFTGKRADRYVYGAMNDLGAMHGSKETSKGKRMEKKHEEKLRAAGLRMSQSTR
jgi:hypothetical protein